MTPTIDRLSALRDRAAWAARRAELARLFLLVAVPLIALACTSDYFSVARYFHGDEAVYYTMAQSIGLDGDLRYERSDLERVFEEFNQGPQGIVLKGRHEANGEERVYYAKPFLYSALVSPLVRMLRTNGAFLGGVLIWLAAVALAARWLAKAGFPWPLLCSIVFLGASAGYLYSFWMQPELLNMALVLLAYFVWRAPGDDRVRVWPPVAAAALLGMVTFSKIPTGVLIGPILGTLLIRRRWSALLLSGATFAAVTLALFALNKQATGEWNYQGGDRSIFYFARRFPYQEPGRDPYFRHPVNQNPTPAVPPAAGATPATAPPAAGATPATAPPATNLRPSTRPPDAAPSNSNDPSSEQDDVAPPVPAPKASGSGWTFREAWAIYRIDPSMLWSNLRYFWTGRYSGNLLYFPFLVLLLIPSMFRRPSVEDVLIWLCTAGAMVCFLVLAQDNYFGGSGTVGNRYFSMMLPPLLFTLRPPSLRWLRASLVAGVLMCGQFVLNPFMTLFNSGEHASRAPFRWFPIELSLVNSISIPNRNYFKLPFDEGRLLAYLPDAGTYGWEEPGFFWTRGDHDAEVVLRIPFEPISDALLILEAGFAPIEVDVKGAAEASGIRIPAGSRAEVPLHFETPYRHSSFYGGKSYLYRLQLSTKGGFVPASAGRGDSRYLGARVRFTADPAALASAYFAQGRYAEADRTAALAPAENAKAAWIRMRSNSELGNPAGAIRFGETALSLGMTKNQVFPHLAVASLEAGDPRQAKSYASELAKLEPRWSWPLLLAAKASRAVGQEAEALAYLELARSLEPSRRLALQPGSVQSPREDMVGRDGIPSPCNIELGGILVLDTCTAVWDGQVLRGRLRGHAMRRPARPVRLFVHLVAAAEDETGMARALSNELWTAIRSDRITTQIEASSLPVPPQLWMKGDELDFEFELSAPGSDIAGKRHVWLGLGLLDAASVDRLPVSSPDLWVIQRRAFVPVVAESRRATRTAVSGASGLLVPESASAPKGTPPEAVSGTTTSHGKD